MRDDFADICLVELEVDRSGRQQALAGFAFGAVPFPRDVGDLALGSPSSRPTAAILSPVTAMSASKGLEPSPAINVAWRMTRS